MKSKSTRHVLSWSALSFVLINQFAIASWADTAQSDGGTAKTLVSDSVPASSASSSVRPNHTSQKLDEKAAQQNRQLVKERATRSGWLGDGTVPDSVRVLKDLPYLENGSAAQKLDLYIPSVHTMAGDDSENFSKSNSNFADKRQNLSKGWPLVVWIHGGGWRSGDKRGGPMRALLESGFAVASINYRLTQEAKWPAQLDDCRTALNFLRAHASDYDLDTQRMGVWGASAGAHLALMLALKPDTAGDGAKSLGFERPQIKGVCDWFGPTDLAGILRVSETTDLGIEMVRQLFGVADDKLLDACHEASPITYVGKSKDVPPILIMHGKSDELVSIRQSVRLIDLMKDAGIKNMKLVEVNGGHGFPGFGADTVGDVINFFKNKLKD